MKVLIVDNQDSFVYNIAHILDSFQKGQIEVIKNNAIDIDAVDGYDKIVLSPGPGLPKDAGLMPQIIEKYAPSKSILGVCLGHQAIVEHFGGTLKNLAMPLHGVASTIYLCGKDYIYNKLPETFQVGHYHSWVAQNPLPTLLQTTAVDALGNCMSCKHQTLDIVGLQYHPESILTPLGKQLLKNWLLY